MIDQAGEKPHILLVEDDRDQAFVAAYYLERGGFIADWCDSPKEAIKTAHSREYTLILLDVMLNAEKDGFQLCQQFKSDPSLRDIPIIMLTARTAERDMVNGLNLGADDYVTKPYSKNELLARIRTVLKRTSFQKHNSRNRELLERTDDIVLFLNREGTIETANRRGSVMLPELNRI
ncbi:response regulator, partial [candidate division KSB1 bacterium]|nr:response regulator [candidate division KSB1 bacterium]